VDLDAVAWAVAVAVAAGGCPLVAAAELEVAVDSVYWKILGSLAVVEVVVHWSAASPIFLHLSEVVKLPEAPVVVEVAAAVGEEGPYVAVAADSDPKVAAFPSQLVVTTDRPAWEALPSLVVEEASVALPLVWSAPEEA
jgi:hypothetical protein